MKKKETVKSYVIFGIGKFGRSIAEELAEAGHNVLAVDRDPEKVSAVADTVTMAAVADVNDARQMENLGLSDFDAAVVSTTGDLSASVMCVMLTKEAGIPLVIAKASDERQAKVFERIGADRVIIPEKDAAARVVHTLLNKDYLDVFELSDDILLAEITLRKDWEGKSLRELDLRRSHRINVAAIRVEGDLFINWDADKLLPKGASIVVIADRKTLDKVIKDSAK